MGLLLALAGTRMIVDNETYPRGQTAREVRNSLWQHVIAGVDGVTLSAYSAPSTFDTIPTFGEWGLALLIASLVAAGWWSRGVLTAVCVTGEYRDMPLPSRAALRICGC